MELNLISAFPELYIMLAWEPSISKVSHSVLRRLPTLGRFYRETKFLK